MSWEEKNGALTKTFEFNNFTDAMDWMFKASREIEKINHHPTWTNTYSQITVELTTHDAGNVVTEKDRKLAEILDQL